MPVAEEDRHRLYQRLEEVLGPEEASTLMELVPPVGWADVATKRDLDVFGREIRSDMSEMFAEVRVEMHQGFASIQRDLRLQLYWLIGVVASAVGAVAAVTGLG